MSVLYWLTSPLTCPVCLPYLAMPSVLPVFWLSTTRFWIIIIIMFSIPGEGWLQWSTNLSCSLSQHTQPKWIQSIFSYTVHQDRFQETGSTTLIKRRKALLVFVVEVKWNGNLRSSWNIFPGHNDKINLSLCENVLYLVLKEHRMEKYIISSHTNFNVSHPSIQVLAWSAID